MDCCIFIVSASKPHLISLTQRIAANDPSVVHGDIKAVSTHSSSSRVLRVDTNDIVIGQCLG